MNEFTIEGFLVVFPVFVIVEPQGTEDFVLGAIEAAGEPELVSLPVFTDYDRAYDYMAAVFPNAPKFAVVECGDTVAFRIVVKAAREGGICGVAFDPLPPPANAQMISWGIDNILEASRGDKEDEDDEGELLE